MNKICFNIDILSVARFKMNEVRMVSVAIISTVFPHM